MPLADIAAIVASQPRVNFTAAVLTGVAEHGGASVLSNAKRLPAAIVLPVEAHYVQTERLRQQIEASEPTRKRLWQQVVRAKISAQARVLERVRGDDKGLRLLALRVRSGDPDNVEAQAARRYWPALLADPAFRRNRDADDINLHFNYGYTVLRAIVARAICTCGLHPSLGLHHANRYDTFCLADDLVEPFRPIVDEAVAMRAIEHGIRTDFNREAKTALLTALTCRFTIDGEERTLFDIAARTASSLAQVFAGERKDLALPTIGKG